MGTRQEWRSADHRRSHLPANYRLQATKTSKTPSAGNPPHTSPSIGASTTSKWRELRNSIRIKASVESEPEPRNKSARIADLCDEDRDKVAKLVKKIVEEESEATFDQERTLLQEELKELRTQAKADAEAVEEMTEKLESTRAQLSCYQERVVVLEEANEEEAKSRFETDRTMDQLKMEVDKLKQLIRRQQKEYESQLNTQRERWLQENKQLEAELKTTREELMQERKERLMEKQKQLEKRLHHTMKLGSSASASGSASSAVSASASASASPSSTGANAPTTTVRPLPTALHSSGDSKRAPTYAEMSSFLNTSVELPEKIKDIMDEWKKRMEEAIASTQQQQNGQLEREREEDKEKPLSSCNERQQKHQTQQQQPQQQQKSQSQSQSHQGRSPTPTPIPTHPRYSLRPQESSPPKVKRMNFDRYLATGLLESSGTTTATPKVDSKRRVNGADQSSSRSRRRPTNESGLGDTRESVSENDWSQFESGGQTLEGFGLYESSLFDVVDAIEGNKPVVNAVRHASSLNEEEEVYVYVPSSTRRLENLKLELRRREARLAAIGRELDSDDAEDWEDRYSIKRGGELMEKEKETNEFLSLFDEVKDIYDEDLSQHKQQGQGLGQWERGRAAQESSSSPGPLSTKDLSVREAVEKDLAQLMREDAMAHKTRF